MRQLLFLILTTTLSATTAHAQTYTQHLQQTGQGRASVVVKHSKEIDELVNTTDVSHDSKPATPRQDGKTTRKPTDTTHSTTTTPANKPDSARHAEPHPRTEPAKPETQPEEETDQPEVDTRRKVMRRSYKTRGYRVQVFAGGNSRNDKLKAQQAGNDIKAAFPNQPVYVHFYSPRWICRMGNFRSYEEASQVLRQVQKLGYKQACIVSGTITVAY